MINREFLEWFDTLGVAGEERDEDVSAKVLLGVGRKNETITQRSRLTTNPTAKYMKQTRAVDPQPRPPKKPRKRSSVPPLPRVATLKSRSFNPNQTQPTKTRRKESQGRYKYSNQGPFPGIHFFQQLFKIDSIRVAPCLVFFDSQILWFGENTRQVFSDARSLAVSYSEVLQSLTGDLKKRPAFLQQQPVAVEQVHKRESIAAIASSSELISVLENWCKAFTQKRILNPGLIMSYASIARGTTKIQWKADTCKERTDTQKTPFDKICSRLAKELSTETTFYSELVCEFSTDRSNRICLTKVQDFLLKARKRKPRAATPTPPAVSYPTWCIGGICKTKGCDDAKSKYPVVYKTIISYRTKELLNDDSRLVYDQSNMYETVMVCKTCSTELNDYVVNKAEKERAQKIADLESQRIEEERKLQSEAKEKHEQERIALVRERQVVELATRMARHQQSFEERLKTCALGGKKGSNRPERPIDAGAGEKRQERASVSPRVHDIYEIACSTYFGNQEAKHLLSLKVMEFLGAGASVRLHASLEDNSNSAEECRLVLRSIYLEFRGLCKDQGYFPDVPCDNKEAVMTLEGRVVEHERLATTQDNTVEPDGDNYLI